MIRPWRLITLFLVFGGLFLALVVRLWFLQIAAGEANAVRAEDNRISIVETEAPRGEILDRNGLLLAGSRASQSLIVDRRVLSEADEEGIIQRLAVMLDVEQQDLRDRFEAAGSGARFPLVLDVPDEVAFRIQEFGEDFPGVEVRPFPVRVYPNGSAGVHILGYLGKPDEDDLEEYDYLSAADEFGRSGVELTYDRELRGTRGREVFQVDSSGALIGLVSEENPRPGLTAVLTIDLELQRRVEAYLAEGVALAARLGNNPSGKAAAVVLNARNGEIAAMASIPAYDPNEFVGGITQAEFEVIQERQALLNLAVQGLYPTGSTFKVVPYAVAMQERIWPDGADGPFSEIYLDAQIVFDLGDDSQQVYRDWTYPEPQGSTSLRSALSKSADVYFWKLALKIWQDYGGTAGEALLQDWARLVTYGTRTGIDLPFEKAGLVPDREWLEEAHAANPTAFPRGTWLGGDLMNMIIGQGDLLATPLQVATSYAALVNGGTVWRPHVLDRFVDADGDPVVVNTPTVVRTLDLFPETVAFLREDLRRVVSGSDGTARVTFADFGPGLGRVGGKTGTAQIGPKSDNVDTAWFVGVAPIDDPEWVVVVVIDRGGGGSKVAAPVVKAILKYMLQGTEITVEAGGEGE